MAPIHRRKKDAADQTMTCLDALRLLDISRDAPTRKVTGPAGEATASPLPPPPPLPQEVEVDAEPETSKLPPPQEVEVEAEPETPKHSSPPPTSQEVEMEPVEPETSKLPSPPPPQEVEVEAEPETSKHSSPPPPSQEVEMEPETSKHSSPPPPSQEAEVEAEPETPKHSSPPPPPQEVEAEAESDMSKHIKAVLKAMLDMAALPDYDERYGDYLGDFFNDLIQTPRPIDPLWLPEPEAAGLGPTIAGRYPYLAGEVARTTDDDTAEQREMLGRGLLQEVDAAWLAALEGEFHEATWAGKKAMLAKLEAEVQYAKARIDAEAMIEMLLGAGEAKASSSV